MWHPYISAVSLHDYQLPQHNPKVQEKNPKLGGGVALYVKKRIKFELHSEVNTEEMR